ncbi:MAG: methylmalonyl-CoA mutase family protein [Deltaproteobacteria bacterium]|nr:methylmalonyl-CoA mutase family protein [Deltaproteobacteria bacterium]
MFQKAIKKNVQQNHSAPKRSFTTISDMEVPALVTPEDLKKFNAKEKLGEPGHYPYTRGIYESMYRGKLWTMRLFAGFGTAFDTNKRFRMLLEHGQTGLSTAFHMPTLRGFDSDNLKSRGEVGVAGVAIDSLEDMEVLFDKIPLEKVTTSMTINGPAAILFAMYIAVAEKQGADIKKISGTIQNDILKEYLAQKLWLFPPKPSMRLITDIFEYAAEEVPKWNTISISGYHIREAGSTAVQELAFTLADGIEYVRYGVEAGLKVDAFAPRLSFFFNCHSDFFEEIAKMRAARRMWAQIMKERFKAKDPKSWMCRFHTQTSGASLTAQQPLNNVARIALQAMAAVLGGTQSLHTNSLDETLALPTEESVMVALRTQQIIAEETGVAHTVDPLAGSYFIETMTDKIEEEAWKYIHKIDELGGMVEAIDEGFPQREITNAAYHYEQQLNRGEKVQVGVNKYQIEGKTPIHLLEIGAEVEKKQIERVRALKKRRDQKKVAEALKKLKLTAKSSENIMPSMIHAAKAYCTLGEMCEVLWEVFGEYKDPAII